MAATSSAQPIARSSATEPNDYSMGYGSLTGQNGSLNPASLRRFMGSPMSFRAGSFGSRFYPGVSPGQLLGPLDPNDFRFNKMSSSIESDRGSLLNVMNVFDRQDELCRDYQCCGVKLTDMHALVDHFEECHVVVVDPYAPQSSQDSLRNLPSAATATQAHLPSFFSELQGPVVHTYHQGSFDPDDMELDMENTSAPSSGSSSPPDTPISTPQSGYPSAHLQSSLNLPSTSSGLSRQPVSAFDTTTVIPSRAGTSALAVGFPSTRGSTSAMTPRAEEAFNAYSGYSDYSSMMPGTVNGASMQTGDDSLHSPYGGHGVPPALLLNSSAATSPSDTPNSSRVASPVSGPPNGFPIQPASAGTSQQTSTSGVSSSQQTARASTTLSRPASSLLLSKPFKCPKPNCNKSYKQANGLKYHMTHGSCNFAPPKDLEHLQALLASRQSQKSDDGEPLSESELREVEKEAERRLRPYACGVGECQRRYKNMNGLRYHYQHSGDHGAIGLALLASGQHECLQHTRSHSRHVTPGNSNAPSQRSSPLATPTVSQAQAAQPSLTYPHSNSAPSYQNASMHSPTYTLQPQQVVPQTQQPQSQHQQPASAVPMQMQYMMQMQQQR